MSPDPVRKHYQSSTVSSCAALEAVLLQWASNTVPMPTYEYQASKPTAIDTPGSFKLLARSEEHTSELQSQD